jgi:hypothetical protein
MGRIRLDPHNCDLETIRQVFLERLQADPSWRQMNPTGQDFEPYVDVVGGFIARLFVFSAHKVFWQLLIEGIVAPGMDSSNINLPWFHVTDYGKQVLASGPGNPHDPTGYLARLTEKVSKPDVTVLAYLTESLDAFRRGNSIASTVMLGIAAERVFLILCETLNVSLTTAGEKQKFTRLLERFPMKPKLDWMHQKFQALQGQAGFPENVNIMVTTVYDLMRSQRNELGHPQAAPPTISREDAFVNLQVFPRYYQIAETVREFLSTNSV